MLRVVIPYLITFMPLIVTLSGWLRTYEKRRTELLHPFTFATTSP
jgi:hypothetical protein